MAKVGQSLSAEEQARGIRQWQLAVALKKEHPDWSAAAVVAQAKSMNADLEAGKPVVTPAPRAAVNTDLSKSLAGTQTTTAELENPTATQLVVQQGAAFTEQEEDYEIDAGYLDEVEILAADGTEEKIFGLKKQQAYILGGLLILVAFYFFTKK